MAKENHIRDIGGNMSVDLITLTADIANIDNKVNKILSRGGDKKALAFKCIDDKKLQTIADFMPEINRASAVFGKQNSMHSSLLMSLAMIDGNAYRRLKQIAAQCEKKRMALKENIFKLQRDRIKLDMLMKKRTELTDHDWELNEVDIMETTTGIADGQIYIEAALKEIGMYMDAYKQICKNHNIPEQWDEMDFEEAEMEHHIKMCFTNAMRDLMAGQRANHGTTEYFSQLGINPIVGYELTARSLQSVQAAISENRAPTIDVEYAWLDEMYNMFKNEYKRALKRSGLDEVINGEWLYRTDKGLRE